MIQHPTAFLCLSLAKKTFGRKIQQKKSEPTQEEAMVPLTRTNVNRGSAAKSTAYGVRKCKRSTSLELKLEARKANRAVQLDRVKWLCAKKWPASRVHAKLVTAFGADAIPYRTVAWHCARIIKRANCLTQKPRGKKVNETSASAVLELHTKEPTTSARQISRRLKIPRSSAQRYLKRAGAKYTCTGCTSHSDSCSEACSSRAVQIIACPPSRQKALATDCHGR